MMKSLSAVVSRSSMIVLLACAPAHGFEDVDGTFRRLSEKQQTGVRELLDLILADGPASRVKAVRSIAGERICGLIDAKNGNDQYLGFRPFVVDLAQQTLHIEGEGQSERYRRNQARMNRDCGKRRL
ncbi:hypothetical protein [Bosea beijingensis]|uniref:hypothetical protein n=1 Tax=Bosea beijingensis TaxID=3068632 RepID=UPI002742522A|nr:hypothetical protein [Bosea sp. REN20]